MESSAKPKFPKFRIQHSHRKKKRKECSLPCHETSIYIIELREEKMERKTQKLAFFERKIALRRIPFHAQFCVNWSENFSQFSRMSPRAWKRNFNFEFYLWNMACQKYHFSYPPLSRNVKAIWDLLFITSITPHVTYSQIQQNFFSNFSAFTSSNLIAK